MTEAFPLQWPLGREKTISYQRKPAKFDTTPGRARDELLHELKLLGASNVVISSNVATYKRGGQDIMYVDQSAAKAEPGVAVYYTWKGEQFAFACDKWTTVMDNLQSLNKTINAIRGIERWGTGDMMRAAFAGFKALPPKSELRWWAVLGLTTPLATKEQIQAAYRTKAKSAHPDGGGTADEFKKLNEAYQEGISKLVANPH